MAIDWQTKRRLPAVPADHLDVLEEVLVDALDDVGVFDLHADVVPDHELRELEAADQDDTSLHPLGVVMRIRVKRLVVMKMPLSA